ncbi:hypothetical protein EB796_021306 [Bugula neritina]|uniref:Uncharacterized protein n=1 Tax=Bugula neritina TaxID=10212 RepID=A0A7J7J4N7_BUGNE|nr:hypothetical protein EB796_021306 [Bugula neritina]
MQFKVRVIASSIICLQKVVEQQNFKKFQPSPSFRSNFKGKCNTGQCVHQTIASQRASPQNKGGSTLPPLPYEPTVVHGAVTEQSYLS